MDTKGEDMTVLRRDDVRGFESKPIGKLVAALAIVAIGVAAAFGISRLIDGTGTVDVPAVMAERGAAMQENVETLTRNGLAQSAAQAAASGQASTAGALTLDQELAMIQARTGVEPSTQAAVVPEVTAEVERAMVYARTGVEPATQAGTGWTLEDELNAIQGRTGVEQAAQSDALGFSYDELAAFHARNGVSQQAQSPTITQPETYSWTLEDELNAINGRRAFEQATGQTSQSATQSRADFLKASGQVQGGTYSEPLSGPR